MNRVSSIQVKPAESETASQEGFPRIEPCKLGQSTARKGEMEHISRVFEMAGN
jgi:hypothetical protein